MKTLLRIGGIAALLAVAFGCASINYSLQKKILGREKRDILVKRVGSARDAQQETQEVFKDALDQFGSVVKFDGGDLQKQYDKLSAELERCEGRAADVHARIGDVERVARDLFREWAADAVDEDKAREQVISAHRVLMSLNDKNKDAFRELVDSLESARPH